MQSFGDILGEVFRAMMANKLRTFLTMFGIAWGVGSLLVLVGLGEGFRSGQMRNLASVGNDVVMMWSATIPALPNQHTAMRPYKLTLEDAADLRKLPELRAVTALLSRQDLYEVSAWSNTSSQVMGVEPNFPQVRFLPIEEGRFMNAGDLTQRRRVAVLGPKSAKLLFPGHPMVGETMLINGTSFSVIGRAGSTGRGNNDSDDQKIYIPLTTMQELFAMKGENIPRDSLTSLQYQPTLRGKDTAAVLAVHKVIAANHGFDPSLKEAFEEWNTIHTSQLVGKIFDAMDVFLGGVGIVTLGLGAVGIINIMLVSVTERTREIGLRKALGATRKSILTQFFLEGLILTTFSGIVGIAVSGGVMAIGQVFLSGQMPGFDPPQLVWWSAALALGSLAICGVVAGVYPASMAASLEPVEALRRGVGKTMLKDILMQAWEAMVYNRRRTMITIIGMAWGIATVVLLLAYGAGFSRAVEAIFAQWGTTVIGAFPGRTSEQAGGDKAGVKIRFTQDDVDRVWNSVPGLIHITPMVQKDVPVQDDLHTFTWTVNGVLPVGQEILHLPTETGRFFSGAEEQQRAHVAVIGSEAKTKLFSGGYAVGESIRLGGIRFTIIGVLSAKMQEGDNDANRQIYVPFSTMGDIKDTKYLDGIWMNYAGDNEQVEKTLRASLASAHNFRPTDRRAIFVANIMEQLSQFRILSLALQVLLALVGALTLGIAGIGLMNIMFVAVQQRTREIGIEKALGAQKRHILTQFLAEAFVITGVGGAAGILLAEVVSITVGRIPFYSQIAENAQDADIYLKISPASVMVATGILIVTGLVSGMIPATRAANLDPIEALRYE